HFTLTTNNSSLASSGWLPGPVLTVRGRPVPRRIDHSDFSLSYGSPGLDDVPRTRGMLRRYVSEQYESEVAEQMGALWMAMARMWRVADEAERRGVSGWPPPLPACFPSGAGASEVGLIPLASTCPGAWRWLMRHVSLPPSSFSLPLWLRPRSSGHRHMPRQNRLRPAPRSRRKISRRARGKEGGASFNLARPARVFGALIGTGRDRLAARWTDDAGLAPQPRDGPHHAIAAARANEFGLGGIFQRMVGQSLRFLRRSIVPR